MMIWVVAIALLFVAAMWGGWWALLFLGAGFFASLHLHPYRRCEACKGTGRHRGSVFTYALRPCHACAGTGRKQRWLAGWQGLGEGRKQGPRWY
jgi:hypothetical protein